MICKHCGHEWTYKGSAKYATCPNCMRKTPVIRLMGETKEETQ